MAIVSAHLCDIGRERQRNEDYIWVDEKAGIYIVADGMGGYQAGDVASQLAAKTVGQLMISQLKDEHEHPPGEVIKTVMTNAAETANKTIFDTAQDAEDKLNMGTTLVVALVEASKAYISHAGDSRAYLVHDSSLTQLTEDDSWANFGPRKLMKKENGASGMDHILTKAVGQNSSLDPSFLEVAIDPGDTLLLCSDGLWNMINDDQILKELQKAGDKVDLAVKHLVAAANSAGGPDNISVVVIKILS